MGLGPSLLLQLVHQCGQVGEEVPVPPPGVTNVATALTEEDITCQPE